MHSSRNFLLAVLHLRDAMTKSSFYKEGTDVLKTQANLGLLTKHVLSSIHAVIALRIAHLGLTAMQWRPLVTLRYHEHINTPAGLAKKMGMDTGAMTRTLDRLEAKGLLSRQRCEQDRRVVLLSLTPEGHEVSGKILPEIAEALNAHLEGFSNTEIFQLLSFLDRLRQNGEAALRSHESNS